MPQAIHRVAGMCLKQFHSVSFTSRGRGYANSTAHDDARTASQRDGCKQVYTCTYRHTHTCTSMNRMR